MKTLQEYKQPSHVEELVANIIQIFPAADPIGAKRFVITRPNYDKPISGDNLYRTSIHLEKVKQQIETEKDNAPVIPTQFDLSTEPDFIPRVVHISNILYEEEGTNEPTTVVVFQTNSKNLNEPAKSITRQYVTPLRLSNKIIKVGYRDIHKVHDEIFQFLNDGVAPV